ncbi:MAG: hypothetical protein N3A62_10675 [Thermodesulfovibrionales bacterium]|nr:hypothetical protein [Thermodesulfovibrionales bacterium]
MKRILVFIMLVLFSLIDVGYASYNGEMSISNIRGDIIIQSEGDGQFRLDNTTYPVFKGDKVITKSGSADITMLSGATIKIQDASYMEVIDYSSDTVVVRTDYGAFYMSCTASSRIEVLIVNSRIRCNTNTSFYLRHEKADTFRINVHYGELIVYRENKLLTLRAGDDYLFDLANTKKVWDSSMRQWQTSQYNYKENYISEAYLPKEIAVYASSFDRYGKWVYLSDYGYCWMPTVVNINVWSPFSCGKYIRRHGREIWISCEPWGWVPYHYGRWIVHSYYGWLWVPPVRQRVVWHPVSVSYHEVSRQRIYTRQHHNPPPPPPPVDRYRRHTTNHPERNIGNTRNEHTMKPPFKPNLREREVVQETYRQRHYPEGHLSYDMHYRARFRRNVD